MIIHFPKADIFRTPDYLSLTRSEQTTSVTKVVGVLGVVHTTTYDMISQGGTLADTVLSLLRSLR